MSRSQRNARAAQGKARSKPKKVATFPYAFKSFVGHLEGSGKALHTIASYRFDLLDFKDFLESENKKLEKFELSALTRADLERYQNFLKRNGHKTNTRRRRLMTIRKFMHYLTGRKKIEVDIAKKFPAPEKVERIPETISIRMLLAKLDEVQATNPIEERNRVLVAFLSETGCQVSEAVRLRWSAIDFSAKTVHFYGKNERKITVSDSLAQRFEKLREALGESKGDGPCFIGYNRYGPLKAAISSRGVELLLKGYAQKLGYEDLGPRLLRHSAVIEWFVSGVSENEIQTRLGLKTKYSFRIYEPIFAKLRDASKSTNQTTSIS